MGMTFERTREPKMLRANLFFQLLEPYRTLVLQCAKNDLVHEAQNDVVAGALSLAISAAHFVESNKQASDTGESQILQSKLQDVADTAKHNALRNPDRTASITTAFSYEFDDEGRFRFIRREVLATNRRYGEFQLVDTLGQYISQLISRFGFDFGPVMPYVEAQAFLYEAGTIVTSKTVDVDTIQVRFFKQSAPGELVLADPPNVFFVVR